MDLSNTFCTVEGIDDDAKFALSLPCNKKYRAADEQHPKKRPRYTGHTTPGFDYKNRHASGQRLAFSLDAALFLDVLEGLTFGSDRKNCDVVLDTNNNRGISGVHFRLTWDWSGTPSPERIMLMNESRNGVCIDNVVYE